MATKIQKQTIEQLFWERFHSKTYWAALIGAILTIVEAQFGLLAPLLPTAVMPYAPLIFPIAMAVLREFTTMALEDK